MMYIQWLLAAVGFLFFCLFINTLFALWKARAYPPKALLKEQAVRYIGIASICLLAAWLLGYA
ncbi:hypothetical protein [Geobacillus subterraneus]|uniref:hypothetical protein n=1 Tax=Geobacillus subterraneus TaxID=129338 RepID=UPI001617E4EA